MLTPEFYTCRYCGRSNFRSKHGLRSHIRSTFCKNKREEELRGLNPSRGALFQEEPLDDDFYLPMDSDDVPIPSPKPPRKSRAQNAAIQAVEAHDLEVMTVRMATLMDDGQEDGDESEVSSDLERLEGDEYSSRDEDSSSDEENSTSKDKDYVSAKQESDAPDTWIRDQFKAYCLRAREDNKQFTEHEIRSIKLMHLLKEKDASLNTYDSVMLWHLQESKQLYDCQGLGDYRHHIGRKTMIERLVQRYNFEDKLPYQKKIKLPVSGSVVKLTLHDAKATIQRLLTDPRIQSTDYLFWEPRNPLARPPKTIDVIKDLNTGRAYLDTHAKLIDPEGREALLPVVIYFDGTAVSHFHDMEITQVSIALGIMSREARNQPYCWAPLGYIEKISEQGGRGKEILTEANHLETQDNPESDDESADYIVESAGVGGKNAQDTHAMIECILEGFVELQEGGFLWDFHDPQSGDTVSDIHFKIFVPFMKLDGKEADFACGKYQSRSNTKQICRKCHIPLKKANDHMAKYPLKTVPEIRKLIDEADISGLQELSQNYLRNAFYKVRFSMGNDNGVHGYCPSELLHAFLLGTFKYVRDVFFEVMGKTSETAKKINALAKVYGKLFTRQSDRTMPGTFFTRGIQAGKLMAKDYRGVLLIILAIVRSEKGREILSKARGSEFKKETTLNDWILLVELMLEWESYMNEPEMQSKHVKRLEKKHRYIMYIMRKVCPRKEGMGLKLSKFHTILHIWEDIIQAGVPLEYDTSFNERFHRPSKSASRMTQKATDTFNEQTAKRLVEFFLIDLAMYEIQSSVRVWDYFDRKQPDFESDSSEEEEIFTGDTRIRVFEDENTGEACFNLAGSSKHRFDTELNFLLLQFLIGLQNKIRNNVQDRILDNLPKESLLIYTCHRRNGQIFRGHPNYRGKGAWKDWVWIDWGPGYGRLPSHIWCFVKLENIPTGRGSLEYGGIRLKNGVFAVVEGSTMQDSVIRSELFSPITKDVELQEDGYVSNRTFYLADTEAFLDPACVIPNLGGKSNEYFVVKPRNQWADCFVKWVQEEHILDKMDQIPETESEGESTESGPTEEDSASDDAGTGKRKRKPQRKRRNL